MRLGYPCLNYSLRPLKMRTFRLASFSPERLIETVATNLEYLRRMLVYNVEHGLLFFRISSDLIPFASHPVCQVDWRARFAPELRSLGTYLRGHGFRVSMHPSQFVILNGDETTLAASVAELQYHCDLLDALGLDAQAKVQIHGGGVYGDRPTSLARFVERYAALPDAIKMRLVVENDERGYALAHCMEIHRSTGVPVLFDAFHHEILNCGETWRQALAMAQTTWTEADGPPMVDYSSQKPDGRIGAHCDTIDPAHFSRFLDEAGGVDCDVMFEIKDKERSAEQALAILRARSAAARLPKAPPRRPEAFST